MSLCLTISYAPIGGIRQFVFQIPIMDAILMGYWVTDQARKMMHLIVYKSKFRIGYTNLRKLFIIPREMLLRYHLRNTSSIALIENFRDGVDGLGDTT